MNAHDPPASPDDVASELVADLERGAELVHRGGFELDLVQARAKLAAFVLPDPDRYVLLLVEAAHLLPGCSALSFAISRRGTHVSFEGVSLDADELRRCFDLPLASPGQRSPDDTRRQRARQRLGLALLTALGLAGGPIEIRSSTEAGTLRFILEPGGGTLLDMAGEATPTPRLSLVVPTGLGVRGRPRRQRSLLREHAYTSTIPLWLDRTRIDRGLELPDAVDGVEILDEVGALIGRAGWSAKQFAQVGTVMFVANGVLVETGVERALVHGFIAIVDASELDRDLSLAKLRRGAAYDSLVERVVAAQSKLAKPVPTPGPAIVGPKDGGDVLVGIIVGSFFGVSGLFTGLATLFSNPWPTLLIGVPFLLLGLVSIAVAHKRLSRGRRNRRVRRAGRATVGVIQTVVTRVDEVPEQTLAVRVEPDGAPAYEAQIVVHSHHKPNAGDRVFLRVDPSDPSVVVLDSL